MDIRVIAGIVLLPVVAALAACERADTGQSQTQQQSQPAQSRKVTWVDDVGPILHRYCADCHLPGGQGAEATGLVVDSYESVMKGDSFGPVVKPGDARTSTLYNLVTGNKNLTVRMPHGRDPLSDQEIETIRLWIQDGAPQG